MNERKQQKNETATDRQINRKTKEAAEVYMARLKINQYTMRRRHSNRQNHNEQNKVTLLFGFAKQQQQTKPE